MAGALSSATSLQRKIDSLTCITTRGKLTIQMVLREHGHRNRVNPAQHAPIQRTMAVLDLDRDLRV